MGRLSASILEFGELPLHRALPVTNEQLLIREMILQLKTGRLKADYFATKFGDDILRQFSPAFEQLRSNRLVTLDSAGVALTDEGFLQVDRHLPVFFEPEHAVHDMPN